MGRKSIGTAAVWVGAMLSMVAGGLSAAAAAEKEFSCEEAGLVLQKTKGKVDEASSDAAMASNQRMMLHRALSVMGARLKVIGRTLKESQPDCATIADIDVTVKRIEAVTGNRVPEPAEGSHAVVEAGSGS